MRPSRLAGPASDVLLPNTTKGYVSIAKADEAQEHFEQTQFGQMLNDEVMDAFVESLEKQIDDKFGDRIESARHQSGTTSTAWPPAS